MTTQTRTNESIAPPLFLALELGGSTWKLLSAARLGSKPRNVSISAGDLPALRAEDWWGSTGPLSASLGDP